MIGLAIALLSLAGPLQEDPPDDAKVRALIELLAADFLEEREPARKALEKAGKAAERQLIEALSHPDYRVRRTCLDLLMPLRPPSALKRASDLFALDDDPTVRDAAFRLLQALGVQAEDAIIGALSNPVAEYRRGAIQSLSEFKSQKCVAKIAELYDRETDKSVKDAAWKCLLSLGRAAEPYLLKFLQDQDSAIRRDALTGLRGSQEEKTVEAVAKVFESESDEAPLHQAYEFLVRAGLRAEPAFLAGLKSTRQPTRLKSLVGLKAIKSERALDPVTEVFLGDCPPDVRGAAADYLKSLGLRAEDALLRGLDGKDPLVRTAAILALGDIGSEKALPPISKLFREEKNKEIHDRCFDFLRRLGIKAEADLIAALGDEDKEIRRNAVIALGDAQSERAIPRLIEFMTELDPTMKEVSESALASIGPKAIEEVGKAVAAGKLRKPVADAIESFYVRGEVERLLEAQLGDDESTGFFEGQFKDLEAFGRDKAVPVLVRILNERSYVFRRAHRHERIDRYRSTMKELAVMALGELGGDGALPALRVFAAAEDQMRISRRVREETLVALHRQGDKTPLEDHLREARANADKLLKSETADFKEEGCDQLFSLGLLFTRLKRYPEATQVYLELIESINKYKLDKARDTNLATTYYNLACLSALAGTREKGVEWLDKAVRAGFTDRSWIRKDRDLDGIRSEPGYRKLIDDDSLFEKKSDDSPRTDK